jgi:hypothetical protein
LKQFSPPGFELKSSYQPNTLWGMGSAVLLAIAVAIAIRYSEPEHAQGVLTVTSPHADPAVRVTEPDKGQPLPARRWYGIDPYQAVHSGFAGFNGYKIVSDAPEPSRAKPPRVFTHEPAPFVPDTTLSYSDLLADTGAGVYSPTTAELLPQDTNASPQAPAVNREVEVVSKIPPKVPWLAQENERGGYVEILVYIDRDGAPKPYATSAQDISDSSGFFLDFVTKDGLDARLRFYVDSDNVANTCMYLVVKEDPREYGFAKSLTDVLPQWHFRPKIRNNAPVGTFVRIGFHFCDPKRNPNCVQLKLISS